MTCQDGAPDPESDWAALSPGQTVEIWGLHADGAAYRWWPATVESASTSELAVIWPAGTLMDAPAPEMRATFRRNNRSIFWPNRLYFITETYELDGKLGTIFADIARPRVTSTRIEYMDYELDVVMEPGASPFVEDEEEFLLAAETYSYSEAFQTQCRQALTEALGMVEHWTPRGAGRAPAGEKGYRAP